MRAIGGLFVLNVGFLLVGSGLLWGLRGWRSWSEYWQLAGVAYLLGVASMMVALTGAIVAGASFGLPSLVVTAGLLCGSGIAVGRSRGHRLPGLGRPRWNPRGASVIGVVGASALLLYFVALFAATRLHPAGEWDAWWVWTTRAKALYFFGDLGGADLVHGSDYPGYPPGLSLVHAAGFVAMGGADTVTLHVQHWFLAVGFAAAVGGVLARRVRPILAVPFFVLALTMPGVQSLTSFLYADLLLAFLLAVAALLLVLWLDDRDTWRLEVAAVLLAGALVTKRDALLFVACMLVASFAASYSLRHWAWPRLAVVALGVSVAAVPWWIGRVTGPAGAEPSGGLLGFVDHLDRLLPSLGLIGVVLADSDLWLGLPWLALIAVGLAVVSRTWMVPTFVVVFVALSGAGLALVIASEPTLAITRDKYENPVDRLMMVPMLVLAVVVPVLLEHALRSEARGDHEQWRASWVPLSTVLPRRRPRPATNAMPTSPAETGTTLPG